MEFIINPYIGAKPILFGMTSEQIESIMGAKPRKFKKSPYSEALTDAYDCFHAYYKSDGKCEAIEFFSPANLKFQGVELLGEPYKEVKFLFKSIDSKTQEDDSGLTSYQLGIGVYAPFAMEDPNELVEGVIVFEKGYYD